jgi:folate-binding protein YgfZ
MGALVALPERGVLEVGGEDRVGFLQGLVSNDVTQAAPGRAIFAALLTPQGRWLADFLIFAADGRLLLDVARTQLPDLRARLERYRLRAKVTLTDRSEDWHVHAAWGEPAPSLPEGVIAAPDPRHPALGLRILSPVPLTPTAPREAWEEHRLALGVPDGAVDLEAGETLLLEARYDELNAISWDKGCYMGQEVTARTRYRGLVKRRLVPVRLAGEGALPAFGTKVADGTGAVVGALRSVAGPFGLALLRHPLDFTPPLRAGEREIIPQL